MLANILGWFFILTGILFVLKPQILQNKLLKKSKKTLRRILFGATVSMGALLIAAAWKYHGLLPKIIVIFGAIGIVKGFILLKSKAADKLIEWFTKQPLMFFRLTGCGHIVMGLIVLFLK